MTIYIPKEYGMLFAYKVVNKIKSDIKLQLPRTNFGTINNWLKIMYHFQDIIPCEDIILYGLHNLKIIQHSAHYQISFDNIITLPGTHTKLITLLKTISYGTRDFSGNKLIVDEFKQMNINIDDMHKAYETLGVVI